MTRSERIREAVRITDLLAELGYGVQPTEREQQFGCDLHGTRDSKPSARVYPVTNSWYCVSTAERVLTPQGWVRLGEVTDCRPVLDGEGHFNRPLAYLPKGVRPCITLKTKAGYRVTVTKDHEVEVVGRGWVKAGEVQIGDTLIVPCPQTTAFNESTPLPCTVADLNALSFKGGRGLCLPLMWSQEVGEVLGYVFGDGWATKREYPASSVIGLTSSAEDAEDARRVFQHLRVWASGRGSETHRVDKTTVGGKCYLQDQYVFSIGNNAVYEWFVRLGMGKEGRPQDRKLPDSLWAAPREAIKGFLRGIYATDGSVFYPKGRSQPRVNLYSVSEGFLQDIQLILFQFGIHSRLHPPASTRPEGVWYLQLATGRDVLTFRDSIGIANSRKSALLEQYRYNPRGCKPFKPVVAEVLDAGMLPVADLSMPDSPTFVAGGIKVHNCFACGKSRDVIRTVMDKLDLDFKQAMAWLEKTYKLPTYTHQEAPGADLMGDLKATFTPAQEDNADRASAQIRALLDSQRHDKVLTCQQTMALWEQYDQAVAKLEAEPAAATKELLALREAVKEQVRRAARAA